jgi:hypothetical protein
MSDASPAEPSSAEENDADQPEEFLNRAARRAKGKKKGSSDGHEAHASQPHGRATVQVKRAQFGNRRTGG